MATVFSNKTSIHSDINNLIKLVLKNCLTPTEDCERTKKEPELIFSPNQVIVVKKSVIKKCLLSFSVTSFFSQIYTASKF